MSMSFGRLTRSKLLFAILPLKSSTLLCCAPLFFIRPTADLLVAVRRSRSRGEQLQAVLEGQACSQRSEGAGT
eukprot:1161904-Pleurochrysis_carterae.AAC.1